jgi:hypothetical protein
MILRFFNCMAVLVLLTGCGTTKTSRAGDAKVRVTHRCTTFDLFVTPPMIYAIELPRVDLSKRGEHVFHVRGLAAPATPNEILLTYPVFHSLHVDDYRDKWGPARLLVEFRDPAGKVIFSHTMDFATASFLGGSSRYIGPHFSERLGSGPFGLEELRDLSDYDAVVTVLTPANGRGHFFRLRGESWMDPPPH